MKKFWMNLLCLLLALSLVFCLCACGSDSDYEDEEDEDDEETTETTDNTEDDKKPEGTGDATDPSGSADATVPDTTVPNTPVTPDVQADSLVGKWQWDFNVAELFNSQMEGTPAADYLKITSFSIRFIFEFFENDTCKLYVDETATESMLEQTAQELKDGYIEYIKATLEAQNMDMTVEEFLESQNMNLDEMVDQMISGMKESMESAEQTGKYKTENGKLYITDEGETFTEEDGLPYTLVGDKLTIETPQEVPLGNMEFVRIR